MFEEELKTIIPIPQEDEKEKNEKGNYDIYPNYEKENENFILKNNLIKLKKICLDNSYKYITTFTTDGYKIKSVYVSYFID